MSFAEGPETHPRERFPAAPRPRVHVVGSLNLDTTMTVPRLPAPGETISSLTRATGVGGKGGNQAIAAARGGATVSMTGAVGSDADGTTILDGLTGAHVDVSGVQSKAGDSGAATVLVDADGENLIVVTAGANAAVDAALVDVALREVSPGDVVVLQNEIPSWVTVRAARRARDAGATVIWNAAPAPAFRDDFPPLDCLVVNEGELTAVAAVLDIPAAHGDTDGVLAAVARDLDADVICTRGADGVIAVIDGERFTVAAPRVTAVDTTAAGDTFVGYFAASAGQPPTDRLRIAAAAGAAAVSTRGAASSIPVWSTVADMLDRSTAKENV